MSEVIQGEAPSVRIDDFSHAKDYFLERQGWESYVQCLNQIEQSLLEVGATDETNTPVARMLQLAPAGPGETIQESQGTKVYVKGDLPVPTRNLMLVVEGLTKSKFIAEDRQASSSVVLRSGNYFGAPIFFVETYAKDNLGKYLLWTARSKMPKQFEELSVERPPIPFLTTAETEAMRHDVLGGLAELSTADIDEAAVVQSWIRRRAA